MQYFAPPGSVPPVPGVPGATRILEGGGNPPTKRVIQSFLVQYDGRVTSGAEAYVIGKSRSRGQLSGGLRSGSTLRNPTLFFSLKGDYGGPPH